MPRPPILFRATALASAFACALVLAGGVACYTDPQEKLNEMQQLTDMADAVNELNSRTSELLFAVDSLRIVVARQDSTIGVLANLAGVKYEKR